MSRDVDHADQAPKVALMDKDTVNALYPYACLVQVGYEEDPVRANNTLRRLAPAVQREIRDATTHPKIEYRDTTTPQMQVLAVLLSSGEVVLAFRGPSYLPPISTRDGFIPLDSVVGFPKTNGADASNAPLVYQGFVQAYNTLVEERRTRGEVLTRLITQMSKATGTTVTKITCTGHGTGAALATLAAIWCKDVGYPQVHVGLVTFGSPRVGNPAFAALCESTLDGGIYRFIHKSDILTTVPSHLSYTHIGKPVLLAEPSVGNYGLPGVFLQGGLRPVGYQAQLRATPMPLVNVSANDHPLEHYIKALQSLLGASAAGGDQSPSRTIISPPAALKPRQILELTAALQGPDNLTVRLLAPPSVEKSYLLAALTWLHNVDDGRQLLREVKSVDAELPRIIVGQPITTYSASDYSGTSLKVSTKATVLMLKGGEVVVVLRSLEANATEHSKRISEWTIDSKLTLGSPAAIEGVPDDQDLLVNQSFCQILNGLVSTKAGAQYRDPATGKKVHGGSLPEVIQLLAQQTGVPATRLTFVGHGLGGALATLAAYWSRKAGFPSLPATCVSFGAPRVGNKAFTQQWGSLVAESLRYVYKADVVPLLPVYTQQQHDTDYWHVGDAVFLLQPAILPFHSAHTPVNDQKQFQAQLRARPTLLPPLPVPNTHDHDMNCYVEALASVLGLQPPPQRSQF